MVRVHCHPQQDAMPRTKLLISSDLTIPFASLQRLKLVYGEIFFDTYVDGLEIIALGGMWNLRRLLRQAEKLNLPVLSIHGAMGKEKINVTLLDHFKSYFFDRMVHLADLIPMYGNDFSILGHTPIFREERTIEVIKDFSKDRKNVDFTVGEKTDLSVPLPSNRDDKVGMKQLWMENHPTQKNGFDATVKLIDQLRAEGINIGMVIDVAHVLRELQASIYSDRSFKAIWPVAMEKIEQLFIRQKLKDDPLPLAFHLPIGSFAEDSVPREILLNNFDDAFGWFIRLCKEYQVEHIVIENQHNIFRYGYFDSWQINYVREWTQPVLDALVSEGVVRKLASKK